MERGNCNDKLLFFTDRHKVPWVVLPPVQKISRRVQQPHIWVTQIVNGTDDFKFTVGIWVSVYAVWDPIANEGTIQSILTVCECGMCVCV